MYQVVKRNKRMWIVDTDLKSVYTPPDFVRMLQRDNLQVVADKFNDKNGYDIEAVVEFESDIRFRSDYRKNLRYALAATR